MASRIVIEEPCEHGEVREHPRPGAMPAYSLGSAGVGYSKFDMCPGGSRRVLTEGDYVLIEKVDGEWPAGLAKCVCYQIAAVEGDALAGGGS